MPILPGFLLQVVIILAIAGLLLWVIGQFPLDPTIQRLIRVVIIVVVCIWLLYLLLGIFGGAWPAAPVIRR